MNTYDKLWGCILGAAVGDAMGAATETRTIEMIQRDFGGYVTDIITPPDDCFVRGKPAGIVTDDFSLAYHTSLALLHCNGNVTAETAKESLLSFFEDSYYFSLAGPTTCSAVKALMGEPAATENDWLACNNHRATNGAGMKIFPVGLSNPGNLEKTIQDTITICMPTHSNNAAIAGGCAIACAVSQAMVPESTLEDVLNAGIYGAHRGFEQGSIKGVCCAAPSIEKRIQLAISIGRQADSWENALHELADIIGTGLSVSESIPCVFGILAATPDNPMDSITMGVNIGNDTDTIATMAGAISGALYGPCNIKEEYADLIKEVNQYDLRKLANDFLTTYYEPERG